MKFRITRLVVVLSLAAAAFVAVSCLYPVEHKMKSIVGDQEYSLLASAAESLGRDIDAKRTLLRAMAEHLVLSEKNDAASLQYFLEAHPSLRDEFFNVVVFDVNGQVVANQTDKRAVGRRTAGVQKYFIDTVKNREGQISPPFRSPLSGKPIVLVTEPVLGRTGKVAFVLAGGINLHSLRLLGQLNSFKPGKKGYFFIYDNDGTVIQHPNQSRILANVFKEPGGVMPNTAAALRGFEGWKEGFTKDGRPALMAYKRVATTGWLMGAVYPTNEAFAALSEARANAWLVSGIVAALAGLTGLVATMRLLRPLDTLQRRVHSIADGSAEIDVLDVKRTDEIGDLSRAFFALSQQREAAEAKLVNLALTDALTGIGNRRMFEDVLSSALARANRTSQPLALAYLDIDHFKSINDTLGHGVGDQVLVEFAKRLQLAVRASDTVARLAGDEFVVVFEAMSAATEPGELGERILDCMRLPFVCGTASMTVTTSIGIAVHTAGKVSADELLKRADEALYAAKETGRNTYALRGSAEDAAQDVQQV